MLLETRTLERFNSHCWLLRASLIIEFVGTIWKFNDKYLSILTSSGIFLLNGTHLCLSLWYSFLSYPVVSLEVPRVLGLLSKLFCGHYILSLNSLVQTPSIFSCHTEIRGQTHLYFTT